MEKSIADSVDIKVLQNTDKELCRHNIIRFAQTYLSEAFGDSVCDFHKDITGHFEDLIFNKANKRTYSCIASPRSVGKSAWTSFALPLFLICYGLAKNILIVSSENTLAKQFVMDIKLQLEDNELIRRDFGDLVGGVWTSNKIITRNGVAVMCKGAMAAMRGVKVNNNRCDYIICDDILNDKNSSTPEAREKTRQWYHKVLSPCVSKHGKIIIIATILNDACLVADILTQPQYSEYYRRRYQAVITFSEEHELWNEWQSKLQDLSDPNAIDTATQFYFDNKEAMTRGTEVIWDREPDQYMEFMKLKAIDIDSFSTEYQNEPILLEMQEFKDEWFERNFYEPEELPEITDVYIGVDAAATAKIKSDDSALVVIGKGIDNYFYVLETFAKKVPISELVDQLLIYAIAYYEKIRRIAIEDVVFQILLKDIMEKKAIDCGLYLPFDGIIVRQNKEMKLRSLIIPIRNGYFKFRRDQRRMLEEFKRFPKGRSDNLMDGFWISTVGVIGGGATGSFAFANISTNDVKSGSKWVKRW